MLCWGRVPRPFNGVVRAPSSAARGAALLAGMLFQAAVAELETCRAGSARAARSAKAAGARAPHATHLFQTPASAPQPFTCFDAFWTAHTALPYPPTPPLPVPAALTPLAPAVEAAAAAAGAASLEQLGIMSQEEEMSNVQLNYHVSRAVPAVFAPSQAACPGPRPLVAPTWGRQCRGRARGGPPDLCPFPPLPPPTQNSGHPAARGRTACWTSLCAAVGCTRLTGTAQRPTGAHRGLSSATASSPHQAVRPRRSGSAAC